MTDVGQTLIYCTSFSVGLLYPFLTNSAKSFGCELCEWTAFPVAS